MTIGLICAIPQELAHLREALEQSAQRRGWRTPASTTAGSTATRWCWSAPGSARSTRPWWRRCWPTGSAAG